MLNKLKEEKGFLVLAAYLFPILLALVALVVEFTQIRAVQNDLKAAVDAAALAGVLAANVNADTIEESVYDSEGNLIRIDKKTYNHRIINHPQYAYQNAVRTFQKNMHEMGWTSDDSGRVTVYTSDLYGEAVTSGMIDAVTGVGVPDNRGDYSDIDEYYFSATARVKTYIISPIMKALTTVMGIPSPVDDLNRIVLKEESKARVKVEITES